MKSFNLIIRTVFFAILVTGTCQPYALAEEGDVFRPYAGLTQGYDSNLRRYSSKDQALALTGSSNTADTFLRKEVGVVFDKQISLQRFYIDISANQTSYDRSTELDNDGKKASGKWSWHIGQRLEGNFDISHEEAMVPFSDFRGLDLNLKTYDHKGLDAYWKFHPSWQLRADVDRSETQYSATNQQISNLIEVSQELGLDYLPSTSSRVGVQYRHTRGDRPVPQQVGILFIDNSYNQDELKLRTDWLYSSKTQFQFLGGWVERKHDEFSERDSDGFNTRFNFNWQATGKTSLSLAAWREINAQSYLTSSYALSKGASLGVSWIVTNKIIVQGNIKREQVDFEGDFTSSSVREDENSNYSLSLTYRPPIRHLSLNTSLNRSTRSSNNAFAEYASNSAILNVQYEF